MKEIEVKFEVESFDEIRGQLEAMGAQLAWKGREETIYFDKPDSSLKKKNISLRLRSWDGHSVTMTIKVEPKKRSKKYKVREEYQLTVSDMETAKKMLELLGFVQGVSYEKQREHWSLPGAFVELDKLNGLNFVEIEAGERKINWLAKKFGLDWSGSSTKSYLTILDELRWMKPKKNSSAGKK